MNTRATPHATDNIHKRRQSGDTTWWQRHGGSDRHARGKFLCNTSHILNKFKITYSVCPVVAIVFRYCSSWSEISPASFSVNAIKKTINTQITVTSLHCRWQTHTMQCLTPPCCTQMSTVSVINWWLMIVTSLVYHTWDNQLFHRYSWCPTKYKWFFVYVCLKKMYRQLSTNRKQDTLTLWYMGWDTLVHGETVRNLGPNCISEN